MRKVAIVGVGLHPWGIFEGKSLVDMAMQATNEALKDAGLAFKDMQAMVAGGSNHVPVLGRGMTGNALAEVMGANGMDLITIHGGCAGSGMVYNTAWLEVASGNRDIVLAMGADKNQHGLTAYDIPLDMWDRGNIRGRAVGAGNPAYWALNCRRRMQEYGTTEVQFAKVAVKAHKNGSLNPYARYKKVFTVEDVLKSAMVADPLRLLMVCPFSHGAAAIIFCSEEKARQLTSKPVWVAAAAMGSPEFGEPFLDTTSLSMVTKASSAHGSCSGAAVWRAYEKAGIGPEDIDFAEIADTSVWHELDDMETFGLCKPGEADGMLDRGETEIGGKLPINASGGFQSFGEATAACGLLQTAELVWQLRGQAGQRQIKNPKVGLCEVVGLGPNGGTLILKV
jgi:acetyl-CoA acetyltransferase